MPQPRVALTTIGVMPGLLDLSSAMVSCTRLDTKTVGPVCSNGKTKYGRQDLDTLDLCLRALYVTSVYHSSGDSHAQLQSGYSRKAFFIGVAGLLTSPLRFAVRHFL